MLGKITKTAVDRLQPGDFLFDQEVRGFGVRRQGDAISFYVRYRHSGAQRLMGIGAYGHLTPEQARKIAKAELGKVAAGIDPLAEREKARNARAASETFGAAVDRYLKRKRKGLRGRAFVEVERHLRVHAKPLAKRQLGEIDRGAVSDLLDKIEDASGPIARNRTRASLAAFFGSAKSEGRVPTNPVSDTSKAKEGRGRERVLTDAELAELWAALPADGYGDIVRLLILTGQRREEIGALRWSEVDLERGLIVLPPERVKNGRQHEVPLSPQAKAIIERQPRQRRRDLIFGTGDGPFSGWSRCKRRLDKQMAPLADDERQGRNSIRPEAWTLHDLRRTVVSGMARLGVALPVVERVVNHVSGSFAGIVGVYQRHDFADEKREALEKWADHVAAITA